jgi:hypothetical protein
MLGNSGERERPPAAAEATGVGVPRHAGAHRTTRQNDDVWHVPVARNGTYVCAGRDPERQSTDTSVALANILKRKCAGG